MSLSIIIIIIFFFGKYVLPTNQSTTMTSNQSKYNDCMAWSLVIGSNQLICDFRTERVIDNLYRHFMAVHAETCLDKYKEIGF